MREEELEPPTRRFTCTLTYVNVRRWRRACTPWGAPPPDSGPSMFQMPNQAEITRQLDALEADVRATTASMAEQAAEEQRERRRALFAWRGRTARTWSLAFASPVTAIAALLTALH
jgi:hypothetical protein